MRVLTVLARNLVLIEHFEKIVALYERLLGEPARLRFDYPEKQLRLAQVGQVLLIGGEKEAIDPFRETAMTFMVDDIVSYESALPSTGAVILRHVQKVPTGRNMLVRHPDGAVVEYVEHDMPNPMNDTSGNGPSKIQKGSG